MGGAELARGSSSGGGRKPGEVGTPCPHGGSVEAPGGPAWGRLSIGESALSLSLSLRVTGVGTGSQAFSAIEDMQVLCGPAWAAIVGAFSCLS